MKTHDIDAVTRGLNPAPTTEVSDAAWSDLSAGITAATRSRTSRSSASRPAAVRPAPAS